MPGPAHGYLLLGKSCWWPSWEKRWPLRGRDRRPDPPEGGHQDKGLDQFAVPGVSSCSQQAESEGEVRYPGLGKMSHSLGLSHQPLLQYPVLHHPQIHRVLCAAKAGVPHPSAGERPYSPPMEGLQTSLASDNS